MNDKVRCINIDWLEVYALEPDKDNPLNAAYFIRQGYGVVARDYGTRVYREMFTILDDHNNPFLEVRRNPVSTVAKDGGVFPDGSCHLRLSNYACYGANPVQSLRVFMVRHGYVLQRIFRLDICLDFENFDFGDKPSDFLMRYVRCKYAKVNQTNINMHGVDRWDGRTWNSISWGATSSMIGTKFYNKTKELKEAKDKPYIRYAWYLAGLVDNPIRMTRKDAQGKEYTPDIWRVEFSIKSSAKKWYKIEDTSHRKQHDIYVPHILDCYDTRERLIIAFASLAHHYFRFKYYQEGVRKDRCRDKVLFKFNGLDEIYKIAGNVACKKTAKPQERLICLLENFKLMQSDESLRQAAESIINHLRQQVNSDFMGTALDNNSRLVLQMLLSERIDGLKMYNISKRRATLEAQINDLCDEIF